MKKTLIVGGLAAVTLLTAGGVAVAQQAGKRGDADGDGRISRAEFVDRRVERLTAMDADRDGTVTAEEAGAARQARKAERMTQRFDRLDTDRNGVLSRAEFEAGAQGRGDRARSEGARRHGRQHRPQDAAMNRGPVNVAEARARTEQAFARLDTNSDGFISAEERQAGRQAMRQERSERRAARQAAAPSPQAPVSE